jgi:membrane-bound inhibitor of C-type lysozyme
MASSSNFEGTVLFTAPAGGVTAGTLSFDETRRVLNLPTVTATSGNTYAGKVDGLVVSAPCASGQAYTAGQPVLWSTGNTNLTVATTGTTVNHHAYAAKDIVTGSTTGDFLISLPFAYARP